MAKRGPDYRKAAAWLLPILGLQGWEVELSVDGRPPGWVDDSDHPVGSGDADLTRETARIWIGVTRGLKDGDDPVSTLFHEILHIAAVKCGVSGHNRPSHEFLWNRLGDVLAAAYKAGVKVK